MRSSIYWCVPFIYVIVTTAVHWRRDWSSLNCREVKTSNHPSQMSGETIAITRKKLLNISLVSEYAYIYTIINIIRRRLFYLQAMDMIKLSLCNRPLRSAESPRLCLPQLAARACHHSMYILGDNPRAQKPPQWPLQKYSRMIRMCTRYLAQTQSGRNGHSKHHNEAHIFLKRGSQCSLHHGGYKMG